eukprot:6199643-Pleurochrysis_carterae.AAC.1
MDVLACVCDCAKPHAHSCVLDYLQAHELARFGNGKACIVFVVASCVLGPRSQSSSVDCAGYCACNHKCGRAWARVRMRVTVRRHQDVSVPRVRVRVPISTARLIKDEVNDCHHVVARLDLQVEKLRAELLEVVGRELVEQRLARADELLLLVELLVALQPGCDVPVLALLQRLDLDERHRRLPAAAAAPVAPADALAAAPLESVVPAAWVAGEASSVPALRREAPTRGG